MRWRSTKLAAASGLGSMKMCWWLNAATICSLSDSSRPLPNTSPAMSPMPITLISSFCTSMPRSRKWRCTLTQPPLAVMPMPLWS